MAKMRRRGSGAESGMSAQKDGTGGHLVLGLGAALPVLDGRVAPDALVLAQVPLHLPQANAPALSSAARQQRVPLCATHGAVDVPDRNTGVTVVLARELVPSRLHALAVASPAIPHAAQLGERGADGLPVLWARGHVDRTKGPGT